MRGPSFGVGHGALVWVVLQCGGSGSGAGAAPGVERTRDLGCEESRGVVTGHCTFNY